MPDFCINIFENELLLKIFTEKYFVIQPNLYNAMIV